MHGQSPDISNRAVVAPRRFHLNLTELCPLRCRHCITRAPEKTANRQGRSMSASVLDALMPWLRRAHHISLCHAGEPMSSPAFRPLLEGVGAGSKRPRIHLMSNGLALNAENFRWAVERGVTSLVVSIDGLSPQTHDWLRVGSSIHRLEAILAELARVRCDHGLSVRLGVSWTVHRENLHELGGLADRAKRWGIDAIKVEELVATTPLTDALGPLAGSLLAPELDRLRQRCRELGLVFVDHTEIREVRRCQMAESPTLAEFIRGDDFINSDNIDPCRAPHDTVYVEPDGTVKPVSFQHRGAGNVLETPLPQIFSGAHFQAWRERVAQGRRCRDPFPCEGIKCVSP
jgi:MoaA/NifB/PqqE/SkfB family radical SAM enzyme